MKNANRFSALHFHFGYDALRNAYIVSRNGLSSQSYNAENTVRERMGLSQGELPADTDGDESHPSTKETFDDFVAELIMEVDLAEALIRNAFAIALFHFWERQSNTWLGVDAYDHGKVIAYLHERGGKPDEATIRILWKLANCLKHGPGKACNALKVLAPHLLAKNLEEKAFPSDTDFVLQDKDIEQFFEAVLRAGPAIGLSNWRGPKGSNS